MFFRVSQGIAQYPPFGGIAQLCWCFESTGGGSQVKAAVSAIGRYRGVSQLYCRKLRLNGPLRFFRDNPGVRGLCQAIRVEIPWFDENHQSDCKDTWGKPKLGLRPQWPATESYWSKSQIADHGVFNSQIRFARFSRNSTANQSFIRTTRIEFATPSFSSQAFRPLWFANKDFSSH